MTSSPSNQPDRGGGERAGGGARAGGARRALGTALYALIVLAVLGGGGVLAAHLLRTGPKAKRRQPARRALLVTVRPVSRSTARAVVEAMGTVRAAQTIELVPRVSGEIVELSPECIPGGRFAKGDVVARIDPADYQLAVDQRQTELERLAAALEQQRSLVAQRESDIASSASAVEQSESTILQRRSDIVQAEAALQIERGQQAVAEREYELLGRKLPEQDRDLVLRKPQLRQAEATCEAAKAAARAALAAKRAAVAAKTSAEAMKRSAEAGVLAAQAGQAAAEVALEKARLDLARTTLLAPFNAVVDAESVDLGSQVAPTSRLATLVGTDEYWVEVSVPVDKLQWLRIPRAGGEQGSAVRIYNEAAWGSAAFRTGTVVRMASALETEGRMARLLVSVPDPLGLRDASGRTPALLIGSYVRCELEGAELEDVVPLDRDLVHEGDRVWVMTPESTLDIRKIAIAFRGRDRLLVSDGLAAGERLVTTTLTAPVDGMLLRTEAPEPKAAGGAQARPPERRGTKGRQP